MRRLWLTILTAFALGASGVANAAAPACPMQVSSSGSAHDCCDENGAPSDDQGAGEMGGCMVGMACRSAPAVAPTLAPLLLPSAAMRVSQPILGEPAAPSGPLQELFRPPRSL